MVEDMKRVEVGFGGGQVMTVRITNGTLGELRQAVERGQGWHHLETEDGSVSLDLEQVVFVRTTGAPHTIGFSGP
ncbi:MAG TPA: hypothetical protein VKG89_02670 [Solirubrobacterales bacterium]|nr:hypothetical protein [Solirubrobacterales bacterium]